MQLRTLNLKHTGIVQATGALLGILSAVIFPDGGHPSLAVLIGLVVIPLNLLLALSQPCILSFGHRQLTSANGCISRVTYLPVGCSRLLL